MAQTDIFSRLSRMFSTDTVIRNIGGKQIKTVDVNKIQTSGRYQTNALVDRFSRLYLYNNRNVYNPNLNFQTLRIQLYVDYEAMDTDSIIMSALDIVADEATLKNDQGEILSIKSSDENIQRILYNLFYDILNIEFNLWSWTRNMCKYGDFFLKLEIAEEFGVYNVLPYTVYHMSRQEGADPNQPAKVTFTLDPNGMASADNPTTSPLANRKNNIQTFENYEIAHFRLISDTNYLPYGRSYIEPARKSHKQLILMEDAMMIHRIMRAPEKRTFYINVGQIPANEVEQFMQRQISNIKKTPYIDERTGDYNLKFNMMNMLEDFYIPVRGGDTSTRIETTPGLTYDGITDIEYFRSKVFAALKIPKAYFGFEGDLNGKATLAAEDIRFARTVQRIQRILESELTKIALVHLYTQGYRGESLVNFEINLTNPSIIFEQEKVALMKEKIDLAASMLDSKLFSTDYIYDHIFNLSEDEYSEMRDLINQDYRRIFRLSQIENEGNDPAESGKSYGTAHDLATLYGRRLGDEKGGVFGKVPLGYEDSNTFGIGEVGPEGGRPKTHASHYGTNDGLGGRDPLGQHGMKGGFPSDNENVNEQASKNLKTKSILFKNMDLIQEQKEIVFKKPIKENEGLLDESRIEPLDN